MSNLTPEAVVVFADCSHRRMTTAEAITLADDPSAPALVVRSPSTGEAILRARLTIEEALALRPYPEPARGVA